VVSVELLRDVTLIEHYVAAGMGESSESTWATRRAILRRVAARLDPAPPALPSPIAYRRVKPPYASWEIARYRQAVEAQPTAARRWSGRALLGLGLGCGLDRPDLAWVRGVDVTTAGDAVTVTVSGGPRPRRVVALSDYAELIEQCAMVAGDRLLIGGRTLGRHNVTTPILTRLAEDRSIPPILPARLRSTWLVRHLDLRTPLSVLLAAAGLQSSRSLDDLLGHTRPIPEDRVGVLLRGRAS
jgi:hypothetical protein